jgi:hypothetical protein
LTGRQSKQLSAHPAQWPPVCEDAQEFQRGRPVDLALHWNKPYPVLRLLQALWDRQLASNETPADFRRSNKGL